MRKRQGKWSACVAAFILAFVVSAIFFCRVFRILAAYIEISECCVYSISVSGILMVSIIATILAAKGDDSEKNTNLKVWTLSHITQIELFGALPILLLISYKPEIIISMDELKEWVSVSWTMFTVTIAVYAVWCHLIPKYLSEKRFHTKGDALAQKGINWANKCFRNEINSFYISSKLIAVNLIVLLISTIMVYLSTKGVNLINQTVTRFGMFICVNTLALLFLDMLKAEQYDKYEILKKVNIGQDDIMKQYKSDEEQKEMDGLIYLIDSLKSIDEEQKERVKRELRLSDKEDNGERVM